MFLSQVASAVHYLHVNHIVHGDLRAEYVNVLAADKVRFGQILARKGWKVCQFLLVSLFNCYDTPFPSCCYTCFERSLSYENEVFFSAHSFSCRSNSLPCERLCTRTRFEKETKSNSEMAYSANSPPRSHTEPYYSFVSEEVCL